MNTSGKSTCKEVRSKCKCIVKEKPLQNSKKDVTEQRLTKKGDYETVEPPKENICKATITGKIILPANCCAGRNSGSRDKQGPKPEKIIESNDSDCMEAYRDLGECLHKCILKQCDKNSDPGNNSYGEYKTNTNSGNSSNGSYDEYE